MSTKLYSPTIPGPVQRLYLTTRQGKRIIVFVERTCSIEQVMPDGICEIRFIDGSRAEVETDLDRLWELLNPKDSAWTEGPG